MPRRPNRNHVHHDNLQSRHEYTDDEIEFLLACEAFRIRHNLQFLYATDYMKVLIELGYEKKMKNDCKDCIKKIIAAVNKEKEYCGNPFYDLHFEKIIEAMTKVYNEKTEEKATD